MGNFYVGAGNNYMFGLFGYFDTVFGMPLCGYKGEATSTNMGC